MIEKLKIKLFRKYIVFGLVSFIMLFLLKKFYLIEYCESNFLDIIFLNFGRFEIIGFPKLTLPFIAAFFIIICIAFFYVSQQFVKLNNTYYLTRFSLKKEYIVYLLRSIWVESAFFMIEWILCINIFIFIYYDRIIFDLLLICMVNIIKLWIMICNVYMLYLFIVLWKKKENPILSLLLIIMLVWIDFFLNTHIVTLYSSLSLNLIYILIGIIVLIVLYFVIISLFKKGKEVGGII